MSIEKAIAQTFQNMAVVKAITSTIAIIMLGYVLRKRGVFTEQFSKILTKVVLSVALPALAFTSFMTAIKRETFHQGMAILIWGIAIFVVLILATKLLYCRYQNPERDVLRVLTDFGSTTFFGIPIVGGIYGAKGTMYASIFNIGYRLFLYSYAYIAMSGQKMTRKNLKSMALNPIVIATFVGLALWLAQPAMPTVAAGHTSVAFYRIDVTAPWLFQPLDYLGKLASPLAWLSIGSTLGGLSLGQAMSDKHSWYYSFNKVIIVPIINIACLTLLTATHVMSVDGVGLGVTIIMMATPAATVAVAYAINFDRSAFLASNASLLSTVVATVAMPFWIMIAQILGTLPLFK